jgi:hypothetical protein
MLLDPVTDSRPHWLTYIREAMLGIGIDSRPGVAAPLAVLIGAGASHSSGGPRTVDILDECKRHRGQVFPDDDAVYEKFSDLAPRERDRLIQGLFTEITPYVGYRCLAAMARTRPVFVIDLNWDNGVGLAAEKVGVPFARFDLKNTEKGRRLIDETLARGNGILCAHVHGYLDAPKKAEDGTEDADGRHGIRFSHPETGSFDGKEMLLLEELLAPPTIVVGTSLVGSPDAHQMVQALQGKGGEEKDRSDPADPDAQPAVESEARPPVEPLWVFERGAPSRAPGFGSRIAVALSNALLARKSENNFVGNTNVDFDMLMVALRAEEVGLAWPQGNPTRTRLPRLEELVPPNPDAVRPLLDGAQSLIVGAPYVGSSTLAFLLAWWRCLIDTRDASAPARIVGLQGPGQAVEYLEQGRLEVDGIGAIVIDDVFDEGRGATEARSVRDRLAEALKDADGCRILATASPDAAMASACGPAGSMGDVFETTVVRAPALWRLEDLRAWAKAKGGERAELVCREIRMGLISTPSQAARTLGNHVPHEQRQDWRDSLRRHLDDVYGHGEKRALALAMLRLQDFSVPRSEKVLTRLAGKSVRDELVSDPWNLCTPIEVDGEKYLRLSNPGVVRVIDDWMAAWAADDEVSLEGALRATGGRGRWAVAALGHWSTFRETDARDIPEDLDAEELELFGSEYVKRALEEGTADAVVEALWRIWNSNPDHWTAKEVALDLATHWEDLRSYTRARGLRNALLKSKSAMGAYALFEALMRVGRPVSIELWEPTVSRLLDLAQETRKSKSARRQVALSFDAVLWRKCPVSQEQERKLIHLLLESRRDDDRLHAAMAAACAYHFEGAKRLDEAGFELPILGTDVDAPQAREMAWLVAWHFVHQSRCRALASRRAFRSTMDGDDEHPRYLDRSGRQNRLDDDHATAVVRYVDALLRHPETAGWALHLIMNVHATTGAFDVPDQHISRLHELLSPNEPGRGVLSAALTYAPPDQIYQLLLGIFKSKQAKEALQEGLRHGIAIEGSNVADPRFSMGSDPWAIRTRWYAMPDALPFDASVPQELIDRLADRVDQAVEEGKVDRDAAERAIAIMARGHTMAIEAWPRPSKSKQDDELALLRFVADYYSDADDV